MNIRRPLAALCAAAAIVFVAAPPSLAHDPLEGSKRQSERGAVPADSRSTLTGTVHELIVDDTTRGTANRYVELELDDGTLVPLQGPIAARLVRGARVDVSGRHNGKPLEVDAAQIITPAFGATAEPTADVEGTFAVLHADDFAGSRSTFIYEIHQASGKVNRLRMGSPPAALQPGARVRVVGRAEADGESLTPDRITILARPAATSSGDGTLAKAATANSVLLVMANFNNTATPAFTTAQAQQVMITNADSVANFFREVSYGQQLMNVTVTGWVNMTLAQPASCNSSDWKAIGTSADAAAKTLGAAYDPANFNYVVYLFPSVPACGWLGLAYIGYPHLAWINGTGALRTQVVTHEMGHNFGLLHAASLRCGGGVIGGSCSVAEYGDPFDTMGNQRAMHYNAMQKAKLAWIPSSAVKTHAGGSATYTLNPIEAAGGTTYTVQIPTAAANRTYWLEFRQPIGFDSPLSAYPNNGAQIRVASPFENLCSGCDGWSDDTQLLDMTPATSGFTDATLPAGQTFSDPTYGVQVTVISATASALTVQVATGGATTTSSSTTLSTAPNPSFVGNSVTLSAAVTGTAPSGTVRFTDGGASIPGCSANALAGSGNTRTATCVTSAFAAGAHAIAANYSGDSGNSDSTSPSITQVVNAAPGGSLNVALAANGGVASASSTMGPAQLPANVNDNQRSGAGLLTGGGGWADANAGVFPDWVQIDFNGPKTIDHVVVYSVQDNFLNPVEPTDTMTFALYGLTSFSVQGWDGASWVTLGSVSGNNLIKRTVSFAPYTTDRIRVVVTAVADNLWSRITEIEAWGN